MSKCYTASERDKPVNAHRAVALIGVRAFGGLLIRVVSVADVHAIQVDG